MSKHKASFVSATAEMTCLLRARSYGDKRSCYKSDDFIAVLIGDSLHSFFSSLQKSLLLGNDFFPPLIPAGIYEYIIARTRYIDNIFSSLNRDFTHVFIVGAGFDSRSLRFQTQLCRCSVYEIDHPNMQKLKKEKLEKLTLQPPQNTHYLPIDFGTQSLKQVFEENAVPRGQQCLFLIEGLIMYLQADQVDSLFRTIDEYSGKGSQIVFDSVTSDVIDRKSTAYGAEEGAEAVQTIGEKWTFGLPKTALADFLHPYGFALQEKADADDLERQFFTDSQGKSVAHVNDASLIIRAVRVNFQRSERN